MEEKNKPSYLNFDDRHYPWQKGIDYRKNPELYKVGKGEQGVLICQPYKSEIGLYWRFKTKELAMKSSQKIYEMFLGYLAKGEFIGADMARKYLQMGFTRARRYANYKGGKKYDNTADYKQLARNTGDSEKALSAEVFYLKWRETEANSEYTALKRAWKERYD